MTPLDAAIASILAHLDSPAVRLLCEDARGVAARWGEVEGLAFAEMLQAGVRTWVAYERRMRGGLFQVHDTREAA